MKGWAVEIQLEESERQRCEVWSRVMGYHRPTSSWNIGKRAEHADRKFFREDKANLDCVEVSRADQ